MPTSSGQLRLSMLVMLELQWTSFGMANRTTSVGKPTKQGEEVHCVSKRAK
jgi:hypothetical protein